MSDLNIYLMSVIDYKDEVEFHVMFDDYLDFVNLMDNKDFSHYEGTGASYKLYEGSIKENSIYSLEFLELKRTGYCVIAENELVTPISDLSELASVSLSKSFEPHDYTDERAFLLDLKNQKIDRELVKSVKVKNTDLEMEM